MTHNIKKYEKVAIYLDGGDVALSDEELKLAREIQQDQQAVSAWIDDPAKLPRRDSATIGHGPIWKKVIFTTLAAAASIVVVASIAINLLSQPKTPTPATIANNGISEIIESISEIDQIKQQQQEAEFASLLLREQTSATANDPVAEDISANTDQWFQALSSKNQQGLLTPNESFDRA